MTESYISVNGRRRLCGRLTVQGSKNAALPCLTACLMCENGSVRIGGCPCLSDVGNTLEAMRSLGCRCEYSAENETAEICAENLFGNRLDYDMMNRMRSSILFMGALISRTGEAEIGYPGGCEIGARPIDLHLKAFRKLGVHIEEDRGVIRCRVKGELKPCVVSLLCPSVGATENIMLLMAKSSGETVIMNAAREPEIIDLQNLLNGMGAKIKGAGSDTIVIDGAPRLTGAEFRIMPDRIAAATYMAAVAACGGDVLLENIGTERLAVCSMLLRDMGAEITSDTDGSVRILMKERPNAVKTIKTMSYPGFPTDAQPMFMAAATVARGTTVFIETVFENRFRHASELRKLGADIDVNICQATVRGTDALSGTDVTAYDLRGGAAMVIGGLIADGTTRIRGLRHIRRGYRDIVGDFERLGADIRLVI